MHELNPYDPFSYLENEPIELPAANELSHEADRAEGYIDPQIIPDQTPPPDVMPDILPDMLPEGYDLTDIPWHVINWREASDMPLQPYTLIEGVPSIRDFNSVEEGICAAIKQTGWPDEGKSLLSEPGIAVDRISNTLRPPKGFGSVLQFGQALVLPYDHRRTLIHLAHRRHQRPVFEDATPEWIQNNLIGANVIYGGILKGSRGVAGQLHLETTYYAKRIVHANVKDLGRVRRTVGRVEALVDIEKALIEQRNDSQRTAHIVAANGIAHAYSIPMGGANRQQPRRRNS
jgi:hypothetical protein